MQRNIHELRLFPRICEIIGEETMQWSESTFAPYDWYTPTKQIELKKIHAFSTQYVYAMISQSKLEAADRSKTQHIFFEYIDGLYVYHVNHDEWGLFRKDNARWNAKKKKLVFDVFIPRDKLKLVEKYTVTQEAREEAAKQHDVWAAKCGRNKKEVVTSCIRRGVCMIVIQKKKIA